MRKITNIFPVSLLDADIDNFQLLNAELIPKISNLFDSIKEKRVLSHSWKDFVLTETKESLGYSSFNDHDLSKDTNFEFFFIEISELITEFFSRLGYTQRWSFENAWCNIYPENAFVPLHDHRGIHWSGVYYVQAEKNCGDIIFTDPKEYALSFEPENTMYRGNNDFRIEPTPGKILLFPGYLKHETKPNLSNSDRIIISFNINCHD